MSGDFDVVTGAFSYSGAVIASELQAAGRQVRTLTGHLASLTQWITDHKGTLGRTYASELTRHFR